MDVVLMGLRSLNLNDGIGIRVIGAWYSWGRSWWCGFMKMTGVYFQYRISYILWQKPGSFPFLFQSDFMPW